MMLCFWACRPLIQDLACCSFRMMKGRPYSSKTMDICACARCRRSGLCLLDVYFYGRCGFSIAAQAWRPVCC